MCVRGENDEVYLVIIWEESAFISDLSTWLTVDTYQHRGGEASEHFLPVMLRDVFFCLCDVDVSQGSHTCILSLRHKVKIDGQTFIQSKSKTPSRPNERGTNLYK